MQYEQPRELIAELSSLPISSDFKVVRNTLDNQMLHVSGYFSPHDSVSKLSYVMQNAMKRDELFTDLYDEMNDESLLYLIRKSSIKYDDPYIYTILKMILMESFSLVYATENQPELFVYYSEKDANRLHENINYATDVLGQVSGQDYTRLIQILREIDKNTMYLYSTDNTVTITQDSTTNNVGHTNLVKDSIFADVYDNWTISSDSYIYEDNAIYNYDNQSLTVTSNTIPVYQGDMLSFSADTTGTIKVYATDNTGKVLDKFTDYYGNVIYDGVIAEANEIVNDTDKRYHGLIIPTGVNFLRMEIKLDPVAESTGFVREPMMTFGNVIGGYVEG